MGKNTKGGTLGERDRLLRKEGGLTQKGLAKQMYISESYIARIEADKRNPSMDVTVKLAEIFHVTADYLINGEADENEKRYIREWEDIIKNRSDIEINRALNLVKAFFDSIDESK